MIHSLANRIAIGIKRTAPDHPASVDVLRYSLATILNALFIIGFSLAISLFTGHIVSALIVLFSFALLRQVSGGIHLKDGTLCVIVSTAGVTVISFADFGHTLTVTLTLISLLLTAAFAPSRIERQTRIKAKFYPLLKLIAILVISSNFLFGSTVLALTFFVQSSTLIRSLKGGEKG